MKYDDILHLPHPEPQNHPRMSRQQRAAQFSPFAALVGYDAAIEETARLTDDQIMLDADRIAELDATLQSLQAEISSRPEVTVTYFCPDERKSGGAYRVKTGRLKRIDDVTGKLFFDDHTKIEICKISRIE